MTDYFKSIRPIETRYKGYRFRSRLEARWAVFFDALGLPWQYEPEGFHDGKTRYLPDFFVGEADDWRSVFVEVKPFLNGAPPKPLWLAKHSNKDVVVCAGPPSMTTLLMCTPDGQLSDAVFTNGHYGPVYKNIGGDGAGSPWPTWCGNVAAAFNAAMLARGARFEFGESGVAQ